MSLQAPLSPQRYDPSLDPVEEDEAQTAQDIAETMLRIAGKTFEDGGHAIRSVHAKSHGLLKAELEVPGDLPPVLAQGLFARAGRYPTLMRFSTIPGDLLDDKVSTPRGLAIKVLGVQGERLEGAEGATTDFVMFNRPASRQERQALLRGLKLVAATRHGRRAMRSCHRRFAAPKSWSRLRRQQQHAAVAVCRAAHPVWAKPSSRSCPLRHGVTSPVQMCRSRKTSPPLRPLVDLTPAGMRCARHWEHFRPRASRELRRSGTKCGLPSPRPEWSEDTSPSSPWPC